MTKQERHAAIRERAAEAIRDLYHNATPCYPLLDDEQAILFQAWFDDMAVFEIEYLQDGGAYGNNYCKTLSAECNGGRYKSRRARDYYIRKGMRDMVEERARCNRLDSRQEKVDAMWEYAAEYYGHLYTYGRGGRTLAPEKLVETRGGSCFSPREGYADDMAIGDVVTLIRVVESFNRFVAVWCRDVPNMWSEFYAEQYGGQDVEDVAELSETE